MRQKIYRHRQSARKFKRMRGLNNINNTLTKCPRKGKERIKMVNGQMGREFRTTAKEKRYIPSFNIRKEEIVRPVENITETELRAALKKMKTNQTQKTYQQS